MEDAMTIYPTPAHDPAVYEQIYAAVARLYDRARIVFGKQCEATVSGVSFWYVDCLRGKPQDPAWSAETIAQAGIHGAREIVQSLVDHPDFAWWGTPLGRAVAWHIGYTKEQVPREVVATILDVSRQRIHQLVVRKIEQGGNQPFLAEEVRALLRHKWANSLESAA
jgi:hypothetical protein